MPWSNNKSPWDGNRNHTRYNNKTIQNDKNFGEGPPDFDDFLRKGRNFIKKIGSNGIIFFVIAIGIIFWLMQCFYIVEQNEQTVELRFGKPKNEIITDGLHFHLWPIDTYKKVSRTEQTATIGTKNQEGLMLSGDQNIVHVDFSVYYYIIDPSSYLFNVNDQVGTIQQVAESAMREVVGRRPADDVYRKQREAVANEVRSIIQTTINKYSLGVDVTRVSITEAAPPHEVASAFNSVQQAEQERNRAIEQGNQERAKKRGSANGEASRIREEAAAYKEKTIEEALGESKRFSLVAKEARISPEATRLRIYIEAFEKLLSSPGKLIIEKSSGTVLQHLPLNEFLSSSKIMQNKNSKEGNK